MSSAEVSRFLIFKFFFISTPSTKAGAERCDTRWEPINMAAGAAWLCASWVSVRPGGHVHVSVDASVSVCQDKDITAARERRAAVN